MPPAASRPGLIARLSGLTGVADEAVARCEATMPQWAAQSGPVRAACGRTTRWAVALHLRLVAEDREPSPAERAALTTSFTEAAVRGMELDGQLQFVRRIVAHVIGRYWDVAGVDHAAEMLGLSAATDRFHHRLEQLLVDAYCRQLGGAAADERLQRARADALLAGAAPPGGAPPATAHLVVVLPADPGAGPATVDRGVALRTSRDGVDVLVVGLPGHRDSPPDGHDAARIARRRIGTGGRPAAVAVAHSPHGIPAAYERARRLLRIRPLLAHPPELVTVEDVLPESLLLADPEGPARLTAVWARLADTPALGQTLTVFLDADLDRTATAARLHIHRRTLTQRLDRIRDLTGHDPRSSRGLQVLGLALAVGRMAGAVDGAVDSPDP